MTGKPSGLDLREHKATLPLIAALPRLSEAGRRQVSQLMHAETPDAEQVTEVIGLVADAGGLEYARERAQRWASRADAELDHLPPSPARELLRASVAYALERRR